MRSRQLDYMEGVSHVRKKPDRYSCIELTVKTECSSILGGAEPSYHFTTYFGAPEEETSKMNGPRELTQIIGDFPERHRGLDRHFPGYRCRYRLETTDDQDRIRIRRDRGPGTTHRLKSIGHRIFFEIR